MSFVVLWLVIASENSEYTMVVIMIFFMYQRPTCLVSSMMVIASLRTYFIITVGLILFLFSCITTLLCSTRRWCCLAYSKRDPDWNPQFHVTFRARKLLYSWYHSEMGSVLFSILLSVLLNLPWSCHKGQNRYPLESAAQQFLSL